MMLFKKPLLSHILNRFETLLDAFLHLFMRYGLFLISYTLNQDILFCEFNNFYIAFRFSYPEFVKCLLTYPLNFII